MTIPIEAVVIVAALLADITLSLLWSPFHYRWGIPVYLKRFPADPQMAYPLPVHELQDEFRSWLVNSIHFHQIAECEYAFREQLFQVKLVRYTPIMRGHLYWDYPKREVRIRGLMNWYVIAFLAVGAATLPSSGSLIFVGIMLAIFSLIYALQAYSFTQVGKYASRGWSRIIHAYGADA